VWLCPRQAALTSGLSLGADEAVDAVEVARAFAPPSRVGAGTGEAAGQDTSEPKGAEPPPEVR
jgi:hypothetical protein